eukprot:2669259-Pleurochrysis_carterae.AAC.1
MERQRRRPIRAANSNLINGGEASASRTNGDGDGDCGGDSGAAASGRSGPAAVFRKSSELSVRSNEANRMLQLLEDLTEVGTLPGVWNGLQIDPEQAWRLRRTCATLTQGIASLTAAAVAGGESTALSDGEASRVQKSLRALMYMAEPAHDWFFCKVSRAAKTRGATEQKRPLNPPPPLSPSTLFSANSQVPSSLRSRRCHRRLPSSL